MLFIWVFIVLMMLLVVSFVVLFCVMLCMSCRVEMWMLLNRLVSLFVVFCDVVLVGVVSCCSVCYCSDLGMVILCGSGCVGLCWLVDCVSSRLCVVFGCSIRVGLFVICSMMMLWFGLVFICIEVLLVLLLW